MKLRILAALAVGGFAFAGCSSSPRPSAHPKVHTPITQVTPTTGVGAITGVGPITMMPPEHSVSPAQYGAIGNGTTNDTTAMQDAINVAAATHQVLWLPEQTTYLISGLLTVPSNTTIEGAGVSSVLDFTWTSTSVAADYLANADPNGGDSNITLMNFTVRGIGIGPASGNRHTERRQADLGGQLRIGQRLDYRTPADRGLAGAVHHLPRRQRHQLGVQLLPQQRA